MPRAAEAVGKSLMVESSCGRRSCPRAMLWAGMLRTFGPVSIRVEMEKAVARLAIRLPDYFLSRFRDCFSSQIRNDSACAITSHRVFMYANKGG